MPNGICEQFKADGFVCPVNLRKNLFTMAGCNNIPHNPNSITPKYNFGQEREKIPQFTTPT